MNKTACLSLLICLLLVLTVSNIKAAEESQLRIMELALFFIFIFFLNSWVEISLQAYQKNQDILPTS